MGDDIQDLPIDIQIGKLVGWLVSRQHCSKDWAENARDVREKINTAIQDMPEHPDIVKLLSGSYINYFHCLRIVEILKETEADSKNILGWYTSQRMKDWQNIVKSYEKGGAGLAESSQLLHQYIAYEIPAINSQIVRCAQTQEESDKKVEDVHKAAKNGLNQFQRQCRQIGITGNDIRDEIFDLLKDLPNELDEIGKKFSDLKDAVTFYLQFVSFTCSGKFQDSLMMLRYIIEHGNVTTYEYIHGEAPLSVEDPIVALIESSKDSALTGEGIDFGEAAEIDFGAGETDIDFGDDGAIDFGSDEQIDFGDDGDWSGEGVITVEESGLSGGVARGTEALSLLLNDSMRNKVIDNLCELEGFFEQRMAEITASDSSSVTLNLWDDAPKSLQMVSLSDMSLQLSVVQNVIQSLSTPKMVQMFLISASHRYVERLTANLEEKRKKSVLNEELIQRIVERKKQSVDQKELLYRQLEQIKKSAKILRPQIQKLISAKYNGRPVNIMGVMNNL